MKTNFNYQSGLTGMIRAATMALIATLVAAGCSKGDGGGGAVAVVPPAVPGTYGNYGYPITSAGGALVADAVGDNGNPSQPSVELAMQFYGTAGPNQYGNYEGVISAAGVMFVTTSMANCGIMPGQYSVNTYQAGQFSGGMLGNLTLTFAGNGLQGLIYIPQGAIDQSNGYSRSMDGGQHPSRMRIYSGQIASTQAMQSPCYVDFY